MYFPKTTEQTIPWTGACCSFREHELESKRPRQTTHNYNSNSSRSDARFWPLQLYTHHQSTRAVPSIENTGIRILVFTSLTANPVMTVKVKTQLAEHPLASPKAGPETEKKPEHLPKSHGDVGFQKEPVVPGIVDFEVIQEELKTYKPQAPSAYRFGRLSHHSFFSRHHPQPHRTTHIQDAWKKNLKDLASRVAIFTKEIETRTNELKEEPPLREQGAKYSAETGRLIPASSQALSRRRNHQGQRSHSSGKDGGAQPSILQDQELLILELLCQILQTDSLSAIQFWLLYAPPKETMGKGQVLRVHPSEDPEEKTTKPKTES
ncbi:thymus brain and testes associated [Cricetulus griseus]